VSETKTNPLEGKRIVITRAAAQSDQLARELAIRGAIPVVLPLVSFAEPDDFAPLDRAIASLEQFHWMIFTSAQAVRALAERAQQLQRSLLSPESRLQVACVGPVTEQAARERHLPVQYVARTHKGLALAEELGSRLAGTKVLLPRSDRANPDLPAALTRYGAEVREVVAYRTLRPTEVNGVNCKTIVDDRADAILFFSPSAVQNFAELFGSERLLGSPEKLAIAAVGPVTAKALREAGVVRAVIAADTTAASVIEALEKHFVSGSAVAQVGAKQAGVRRG